MISGFVIYVIFNFGQSMSVAGNGQFHKVCSFYRAEFVITVFLSSQSLWKWPVPRGLFVISGFVIAVILSSQCL